MAIPILSDIFGQKPEVAGYENVNLNEEQLKALLANYSLFQRPELSQLGNLYQQYMLKQFGGAGLDLKGLISQGGDVTKTLLGQAAQEARGQVPQDVIDFTRRQSAFQNLGAGTYGGAMGGANAARNLGLTSLGLISKGAGLLGEAGNAAQRWASLASGTILPTSSYLINPEEQFQATTQNRLIQRQVQQERYNVAAAPNPIAKGLSDLVAYLTASYIGHGPAGQPPKATDYSGAVGSPALTAPGSYNAAAGSPDYGDISQAAGEQFQLPVGGAGAAPAAGFGGAYNPPPNEEMIASPVGYPAGNWGSYYAAPSDPYANLYGVNAFQATGF